MLFFLFALCSFADGVQDRALAIVLDGQNSYCQRARQIAKVSANLRKSDVDAIHAFLDRRETDGLETLEVNSLKNDLVLCLMRQTGQTG